MVHSKTLQVNGHLYCRECSSAIPEGFLACPACAGFVQVRGHWIAPSPVQPKESPKEEQAMLFSFSSREYPA